MDTGTACRGSGSGRQNISDRSLALAPITITPTIARRGRAGVYRGYDESGKQKAPQNGAFGELPDLDSNQD